MFKKIIILFFCLSIIPLGISAARQLETEYPDIPGVTRPSDEGGYDLPAYLEYVYYFAIGISGVVALIALVSGGLAYLTSAGSPARMAQGRGRIIAGLSGIAIIFGAHLVLNTIDPQFFREPEEPGLPSRGYCLKGSELSWKDGQVCPEGWGEAEETECLEVLGEEVSTGALETTCCEVEPRIYCYDSNNPDILPAGFIAKQISFQEKDFAKMFLAWIFSEKNYQGERMEVWNGNENPPSEFWQDLVDETWRQTEISHPRSIYLFVYRSGFHLFPTPDASYDFSDGLKNPPLLVKAPVSDLGSYNGRIKSIALYQISEDSITNTSDPDTIPWGGVFFTQTNYQGGCGLIFGETPTSGVFVPGESGVGRIGGGVGTNPENSIHSVFGFKRNLLNDTLEGKVTFYSGIDYSEGSPGHVLKSKTIFATDIAEENNINEIWYQNLDYGSGENTWEQEHILSVKIDGKYVVVLNSEEDFKGDCTLITRDTTTLFGSFVLRDYRHGARVRSIAIIPYL